VNVKEYISSGIIESYVMGMATDTERREFEVMCSSYPEIAAARTSFEMALEAQLLVDAIQPPVQFKQSIEEKVLAGENNTDEYPVKEQDTPVHRIGIWKWLAAASLVLLAGTAFWAVSTNNRNKELAAANRDLQNQLQQSSARLDTMEKDAALLQSPGVKMAAMLGTADPKVYATIYWDTASKDVYLMINNLPRPVSDKQYQLWALLNGQPIDLGMIEVKQERLLYRMKNVQNAQAFAITLEPKGGSPTPTSTPIVLSKL
jgi:anti-sigma-K factor RskA